MSDRVWYWAHVGVTALVAVVVATSIVLLAVNDEVLYSHSIQQFFILMFVMPGVLLVLAINQLILWRRRPRVIRTADKVVTVIFVVLALVTFLSMFSFDVGLVVVFFSVPLLIIAGIISTILIAVGNARAGDAVLSTVPVEPGTAPVGATLDELFPEPGTPPVPLAQPSATLTEPGAPPAPLTEPGTPPAPEASPYGPKS